jgi:sugar/nucleoside kinase (ribokinase family)
VLVDLICERAVRGLDEAESFVPHFGGAVANVAVFATRAGAAMSLASGAGKDPWGRWLRDRLQQEGVDLSLFELVDGMRTPLSVVTVDDLGEPSYSIYGDAIESAVRALGRRMEQAVRDSAALYLSSNTLAGVDEREVSMRARAVALELGRPVIFDPNLRLGRWRSRAEAAATVNACVPGALLVRANTAEAAVMTGEDDPGRAAAALVKAGARIVVVTLGAEGAILRGEMRSEVAGVPASMRSTIGAGDAFTGVLLARLALAGFYPPAAVAALGEAVASGAAACERWGALD